MARVEWGHICDHAFFDEHKKPCLIGIFQNIFAARVPVTHPRCAFVFSLAGNPDETVKIRIQIVRPDGKDPLIDIEDPSLSLTASGSVTNNMVLENLPLPDFGPYEIRIFLDDKLEHTSTLTVRRTPK
ncbi:MAG: hypothetical protein GX922_04140 [Firmicutes bacterium]|nr:hypothetical protein [Bacillota bacterium]